MNALTVKELYTLEETIAKDLLRLSPLMYKVPLLSMHSYIYLLFRRLPALFIITCRFIITGS